MLYIVRDEIEAAFKARFVNNASGQWPCDYAGAGMVRVRQRTEETEKKSAADGREEGHHADAVYTPNLLVADAVMSAGEDQNVGHEKAALTKACADLLAGERRFSLSIEI